MFAYIIRFADGKLDRSDRDFRTYSGAAGAMAGRLARVRPERLAILEATAVIHADSLPLRKAVPR